MPKLYTVAEANALLPELTPLLTELRHQAQVMTTLEAELNEVRKHMQSNGHGRRVEQLTGQAAVAEHALRKGLTRLHELDIELKDAQSGLIDFYHTRDGRTVYLCWRLGEPAVAYWHDLDSGFAGRQPL